MFTAVIFVCHMAITDQCFKLVDDRGPYNTENECITRITEMMDSFSNVLPEYSVRGMQCQEKFKGVKT